MGSSKDDSIFFKCWFESYQRYGQVKDIVDIRDQLFACCDTNLIACCDTNLTCTNTCAWEWTDIKSEVELFAEIQKIPIVTESHLVNIVSLCQQYRSIVILAYLIWLKSGDKLMYASFQLHVLQLPVMNRCLKQTLL